MTDLAARAAGAALVVVGLLVLRHYRRQRHLVARAAAWPTVRAEIVESSVHRQPGSKPLYSARIRYRYPVAGASHYSDRVDFSGETRGSRARAEKIAGRYPAGAAMDAFVDPADPTAACLERRHGGAALELICGGLALTMGALLALGIIG